MSSSAQAFSSVDAARLPARPLHLAIGMFDGVHLGHRAVVESAVLSARRSGGVAGVLTFHPHPSVLFRPAHPTRLILPPDTKARILFGFGVDAVIAQPFTPEFARIAAEEFLAWLKARLPHLAAVYVGQNWRFGAARKGDVALLVATAKPLGLSVFSAPPVNYDGKVISSTRIRGLLESGDIAAANALLGYTYFAEGVVNPGRRLGRELGFPTLNLPWSPELQPRYGVYAVEVSGKGTVGTDGPSGDAAAVALPGVANYGVRPTVNPVTEPLLETHLLVPCPFGEGDSITVAWKSFLRPEQKFSNLDDLRAQIAKDVAAAKANPSGAFRTARATET